MENQVKEKIEKLLNDNQVVLFMKGTPNFPQCGFSAQTVMVLRHAGVKDEEMAYFDVLSDPEIRQGIKEFTNWPTIHQVFVKGEFVGGCDVLNEMYQKGELQTLLKN